MPHSSRAVSGPPTEASVRCAFPQQTSNGGIWNTGSFGSLNGSGPFMYQLQSSVNVFLAVTFVAWHIAPQRTIHNIPWNKHQERSLRWKIASSVSQTSSGPSLTVMNLIRICDLFLPWIMAMHRIMNQASSVSWLPWKWYHHANEHREEKLQEQEHGKWARPYRTRNLCLELSMSGNTLSNNHQRNCGESPLKVYVAVLCNTLELATNGASYH